MRNSEHAHVTRAESRPSGSIATGEIRTFDSR